MTSLLEPLTEKERKSVERDRLKRIYEEEEKARALAEEEERQAHELYVIESALLGFLHRDLNELFQQKRAPYSKATLQSYRSDWKAFERTAISRGLSELPAEPNLVALHLMLEAAKGMKALARVKSAISYKHRVCGLPDPTLDPMVEAAMRYTKRNWAAVEKEA